MSTHLLSITMFALLQVVLQAFCCVFTDCGKFLQSLLVNHDRLNKLLRDVGNHCKDTQLRLQGYTLCITPFHLIVLSLVWAVWEPAAPISPG